MLEQLNIRIEKLIALYENEKRRAADLQAQLQKSTAENENYRIQVEYLKRQIDNRKLTEAFSSGEGANPEAKQRLEKLIHEIDKCINLLER